MSVSEREAEACVLWGEVESFIYTTAGPLDFYLAPWGILPVLL